MARKISISFKETNKDLELYKILMSMDDKSYEVKQILRTVLIKDNKVNQDIDQNKIDNDMNILDF